MTLQFFFQNAWRWVSGLPDEDFKIPTKNIEVTEWSTEFEKLQRNRLIMGGVRYGRLGSENKPNWDRVPGMLKYIKEYQDTGNTECLVDVANYCMLEFVEGKHPNKHFHSTDDSDHVKSI